MAVYSAVASSEKDPESPIDVNLIGKLDENPRAMVEGATGAPRVQTAALEQGIGVEAVTQGCIRDAAVGQGQMKTTIGSVSVDNNHSHHTLPGGSHGFYPQIRKNNTTSTQDFVQMWSNTYTATPGASTFFSDNPGTSFITKIFLNAENYILYAQQRYVQASPPYDLGDGEIPLFIFAEIEKSTGKIVSVYEAPEAPWHYNGPTNIKADFYTKEGLGYQKRKDMSAMPFTHEKAKADSRKLQEYFAAFKEAPIHFAEITQAIKNADMELLPRPMEPKADTTVVMLDPVADLTRQLFEMKQHDQFNLAELLYEKNIIIDNSPLNRAGPQGVDIVGYKWR